MSEAAQPLSRRERRELELARAAEGEMTQALPVTPESMSTASRRERRRMERLARPMEVWTAEEEMIATGQIPAMTPEAIAEQERLARERAAQADAEAHAAAVAYAATAPAAAAAAEPAPVDSAPVDAPEEQPDAVVESEPEPVDSAPVDAPDEQPDAVAEAEAPPAAPEPQEIPKDLRALFPPGSLQARAFEALQPAAISVDSESNDAADEIRRLTFEAMAAINRATTGAVAAVPDDENADDQPTDEAPAGEPDGLQADSAAAAEVPSMPQGVDVEALWNAPTTDEPVRNAPLALPGDPTPFNDFLDAPVSLNDVPLAQDVPHTSEPDSLGAEDAAAIWNELVPAVPAPRAQFENTTVLPVTEPAPAPTMWDTHPLVNPGASPVRELPVETPTQSLPRPDLSVLLGTQTDTSVGQAPYYSAEPLTTTGALPNRLPEPQAGGGARHFRWAHLAVIGAIAFVLGVLAWNIARSSS